MQGKLLGIVRFAIRLINCCMTHHYRINQKIVVLRNQAQPWTIGKIGKIAKHIDDPPPYIKRGNEPHYYVWVVHSRGSTSGCVLVESEMKPK